MPITFPRLRDNVSLPPAKPDKIAKFFHDAISDADDNAFARYLDGVADTSKPAPILILCGPAATGKTLIAKALAAMWTQNETRSNYLRPDSPVIYFEEGKHPRGKRLAAIARETRHAFGHTTTKGLDVVLEGFVRVILTTNTETLAAPPHFVTITLREAGRDAIREATAEYGPHGLVDAVAGYLKAYATRPR